MEIILASVGILFALGAAITASVGSGIAAPLVPGYAQKVRYLVRILEPFVRTQSKFVDYLLKSLEKTGSLERKDLDTELYVTLKSVRDASHNKLNEIELLNFDTEAETAARARIWLAAAVVFASFSAVCQIGVLIYSLSTQQPNYNIMPLPNTSDSTT